MATIELSDRIVLDGVDVTESCLAWQLQQVGRDAPTVTLELKPDRPYAQSVMFEGYVNVRIASQGPDLMEFLNALDADEIEKAMMEDMSEPAGVAALRIIKQLASTVTPH